MTLVDTGASLRLINENLVRYLRIESSTIRFSLATGDLTTSTGLVQILCLPSTNSIDHKRLVLPNEIIDRQNSSVLGILEKDSFVISTSPTDLDFINIVKLNIVTKTDKPIKTRPIHSPEKYPATIVCVRTVENLLTKP
ncbi:hypothetical protein RF11_08101 [Thelohanellus kitauei]|uniref:Uncharacterized protein n=1 Tax=Thelohanellus kitauei TaxID=669202 RepID=A0A0C2MHV3_THEKT|nr:hypothetical protein RF11_08101 [Thelohanellus kitauei]